MENRANLNRGCFIVLLPRCGTSGDPAGNVVSYRDMSKDVEIQEMKAEVLRLRAELETAHSFDEIVGKSENMQQMFALMQRAAERRYHRAYFRRKRYW